jgi:hypothetical protein
MQSDVTQSLLLYLPDSVSYLFVIHVKRRETYTTYSKILEDDALWDVAPSVLVEVDRRFGGAYCLHN